MSSNKSIRDKMIQKYGEKCMMEEAGIRKIPVEKRRKISGYRKVDEQITYHHLKPKSKGGKATEENGALLKWYNHRWLESQSKEKKQEINNKLNEYKTMFVGLEITGDGRIGNQLVRNLDKLEECIEIPLIPNEEEKEVPVNPEDIIRARYEYQWEK